jgi:RsiW-degrading membrane proteinase PrsW (M82 family)
MSVANTASVSSSCFFNTKQPHYSKHEVLTLVVIGILFLASACSALYGYIGDPSWMLGAHILAGSAAFFVFLAGLLVLIKTVKSHSASKSIF